MRLKQILGIRILEVELLTEHKHDACGSEGVQVRLITCPFVENPSFPFYTSCLLFYPLLIPFVFLEAIKKIFLFMPCGNFDGITPKNSDKHFII